MDYKVLFVDDDANILDAYKRQLRKQFHIETAIGGETGLEAVKSNGGYAVIVSDLRMPGIDGNQFLSRVKDISPESVRIMLTAYADLQNAIKAINHGNIFRLLTKPCPQKDLIEALHAGIEQYKKNIQIAGESEGASHASRKKRILIVDDDPLILRLLSRSLSGHAEFEISTAKDGKAAVHKLNREQIDLIITDLYMPVMNGLQLLRYVQEKHAGTRVVVLTGRGTSETEVKIRSLGDFQYYEKPLDVHVLVEVVLRELRSVPSGQIQGISLSSFLQIIDLEGKICTLTIRSGVKVGYLYFRNGELIAAETGVLKGEEAARHIINWDNSVIEMANFCRKNRREIEKSLMHILMESARIKDENSPNTED